MNENELEEYENKETEILSKLAKKNFNREKISINDFCGFDLKKPYGFHLVPIYLTLPFYKTQIVNLHPFETEEIFEEHYGISPDQLLELYRKGRVKIILASSPERFKNKEYLDPFLEKMPPTPSREAAFELVLTRGRMMEYFEEAREIFNSKLNKSEFSRAFTIGAHTIKYEITEKDLDNLTINTYASLKYYGYSEVTDKIHNIANINPNFGSFLSQVYYRVLIDPIIASLDGCHPFFKEEIELKNTYDRFLNITPTREKNILPYSQDVGITLFENLKLNMPIWKGSIHR